MSEENENVGAEGAVGTPPPADVPAEPAPEAPAEGAGEAVPA